MSIFSHLLVRTQARLAAGVAAFKDHLNIIVREELKGTRGAVKTELAPLNRLRAAGFPRSPPALEPRVPCERPRYPPEPAVQAVRFWLNPRCAASLIRMSSSSLLKVSGYGALSTAAIRSAIPWIAN